ncbi:MAG: hypothetical protein J0L66_17430 [Cytophagales bacterium]|nr:hypothetical protein [Cytophagales bacterium]
MYSLLFLRIVSKNREVYFLKFLTLAVAFASTTLITLFSIQEFGYDKSLTNSYPVFRVLQRDNSPEVHGNRLSAKIPLPIFQQLDALSKDSITVARVKIMKGVSLAVDGKLFHERKIHATDTSLVSIFRFNVVSGSLQDFATGVLISEALSLELFGSLSTSGRHIKLFTQSDTLTYAVAAVFKNFLNNTHEDFQFFLPYQEQPIQTLQFNATTSGVYGLAKQGKFDDYKAVLQIDSVYSYSFQALSEIYFGPRVAGEDSRHGDAYSILILLCVTGLILFLALTGFVNLTTLSLPHRAKELAIKKLSGTGHWSLMKMFAFESFALVGISFLGAVSILFIFNSFIESILQIDPIGLLFNSSVVFASVILLLIVLSGLAPLLMTLKFARATPTRLLSTDTITFPRFKRIITFLQLGISLFLIVASMVIGRQVTYSLLKEPGRNHYQVVYMPYPAGLTNQGLAELRAGWKKNNPNIDDVIATSQLPHYVQSKELHSDFYFMAVDRGFKDFFRLPVESGRWFQPNDESPMVVINQAGSSLPSHSEVIGVIGNMDEEFNRSQKPLKYTLSSGTQYQFLCVRVLEVNIRTTLFVLAHAFSNNFPAPVSFVDTRFEEWLHYQDRLNSLSGILVIISGILSCLAIYGLSLSLVRDKIKQLAIHKLYGANIARLTKLLVREFVGHMLLALLVVAPITFILLKEFLRNFVYTTPFQWSDPVYPLAYCVVVLIALCGFQAVSLNRSDLTHALKG